MRRAELPITALPGWSKLNDVNFLDIKVEDLGDSKGLGLATERNLSSKDTFDIPTLLIIPHDLILSAEAIEEYAKIDQHFKQLLDVAGGKLSCRFSLSLRGDVMLFLLMQITAASPDHGRSVGLSNPWTEYVKMLPSIVPVPTMWSEEERVMLVGTSLETALNAKMAVLLTEFDRLLEKTAEISWCQKCWWEDETLKFSDWLLVDAWYRSRSLELPKAGESMVPCLDMANHSCEPNGYYEQTSNGNVVLLLRPDVTLDSGSEITISYGTSKSEAEMLFSYGFIDELSTIHGMALNLEPFPDDPLGKAKAASFIGPPVVRISLEQNSVRWDGPFLFLMCLNEEDGLEFRVLQQTDGSRSHLRVFWQGSDVTNSTNTFESLVSDHELKDVFQLRVVALLQDRLREQLERLNESENIAQSLAHISDITQNLQKAALQLRKSERMILEKAFAAVDEQKNKLLENESVLRYLGSMDEARPDVDSANEEEDFS